MLRLGVIAAAVLGLVGVVFAFARFEQAPPPQPATNAGLSTLRYAIPEDSITLNPQNTSALTDFRVIDCLFEGLLNVDPETLELEPGVAEALPEVSEDGRVYTFKLRGDARWSNGDPVTADDFVFAWKRAVTYDFAAIYSGLFFVIKGAEEFYHWRENQLEVLSERLKDAAGSQEQEAMIEAAWAEYHARFAETVGIEALDPNTLRVTLKQPTAYFPQLTAFGALFPNHRSTVEPHIALDTTTGRAILDGTYFTDPERLISNGAFALTSWNLRRRLVMDANPYYWGRAAQKTGRIIQTVIDKNEGLMLTRYLDGEFDWIPGLTSVTAVRVIEARLEDVKTQRAAGLEYYGYNVRDTVNGEPNPLSDARVRKALSMAVDRQALVEKVTQLNQPVADSFVPIGAVAGYDPPVDAHIRYDPEGAKRLLAEAGYPGGAGFPPLTLIYNTAPHHTRNAVRMCNEWKTVLGIDVRAENFEWRVYLERSRAGAFHIVRRAWFGDYQDPTTWLDLLRGNDPNNALGYNSPAYDAKLREASETLDPTDRLALLNDAERILLEDQALLPLFQYIVVGMYNDDRVSGLKTNAWNAMDLSRVEVRADADP